MIGAATGPSNPNSVVPSVQNPTPDDHGRISQYYFGCEMPKGQVHVILDNVPTHKTPDVQTWLARHPRFEPY